MHASWSAKVVKPTGMQHSVNVKAAQGCCNFVLSFGAILVSFSLRAALSSDESFDTKICTLTGSSTRT